VSDTEIKLGSIWMYGHPFGKLAIQPMYRESPPPAE
jgi:hypothetical protein